MNLTAWHRRAAAAVAATHPLDGRAARAKGNHLVAQNDEPEPQDVLTSIARAHLAAPIQARLAQINAYTRCLERADWSDDEAVAELRMLRRELDGDAVIWNTFAPESLRAPKWRPA